MMSANKSKMGRSGVGVWTGRVLTGLIVLFMLFDGIAKIMKVQPVIEATTRLGFPTTAIVGIGIALTAIAVLYLIPQTSVLGAILLTGYLGGAVATQIRAAAPTFSCCFPIILGVLAWIAIYLRDPTLRQLAPLRRAPV